MQYMPYVESMERIDAWELDNFHIAVLFDNIKSSGRIQYTFLLVVYNQDEGGPLYIVSSEVNAMKEQFGGGSHFLCTFDDSGHQNLGESDDWADVDKFFRAAYEIVLARFGPEASKSEE